MIGCSVCIGGGSSSVPGCCPYSGDTEYSVIGIHHGSAPTARMAAGGTGAGGTGKGGAALASLSRPPIRARVIGHRVERRAPVGSRTVSERRSPWCPSVAQSSGGFGVLYRHELDAEHRAHDGAE